MRLLLDTHMFLWWLSDDEQLPESVRSVVADGDNLVHVSSVSVWEASIKAQLGRLELDGVDLVGEVDVNGFHHLPVEAAHAWEAGQLPEHHRDPFDRMLVAQARLEQLVLASTDGELGAYDVQLLG